MKLTQGLITREQAMAVSPDYVAYVEGNFDKWDAVNTVFEKLKRGQSVITYVDGQFVRAKVTSINHNDFRAVDGPIVRVSNGEYSWRVDGDRYAFPDNTPVVTVKYAPPQVVKGKGVDQIIDAPPPHSSGGRRRR